MIDGVKQGSLTPAQKPLGEVVTKEKKAEQQSVVSSKDLQRQQEPDDARVENIVRSEAVTDVLAKGKGKRVTVGLDDDAGRFVYKALDAVSQEVERQYPPEPDLKRSALLKEFIGNLVNKTA